MVLAPAASSGMWLVRYTGRPSKVVGAAAARPATSRYCPLSSFKRRRTLITAGFIIQTAFGRYCGGRASYSARMSSAVISSSPLAATVGMRSSRRIPAGCPLPVPLKKAASSRRSEEHTSELQSRENLVCRLLLECDVDHRDVHSFPTRRSSDLRVHNPNGVRPVLRRQGVVQRQDVVGGDFLFAARGHRRDAVVSQDTGRLPVAGAVEEGRVLP